MVHTLGLLDNGKHNSETLLRRIADMVATNYPGAKLNYYRKPSPYRPAPTPLLDQVASENDAVLVGIGD